MSLLSFNQYREGKRGTDVVTEVVSSPKAHKHNTIPQNEAQTPQNALQWLNEATNDDLCQIKGIGPKTASKVILSAPYENEQDFIKRSKISESIDSKIISWKTS